ncbi:MAG TPA: hypothetical protein VJA27_02080 [Patescibacteria group bacterium]|nr:hypothetical protein [Patescibacteria group bacterium]
MFIMVDGIDGSGKSTVITAWKEHLAAAGNTIFDLREYWKEHGTYPHFSELKSYDFIFSAEPTYVGMGKVIREELIRKGTHYPPLAIAEAYSLDRLILYENSIVPALKAGKWVIQDRGVSTSLCYQVSGGLDEKTVRELPGNAFALTHRPDHLLIITVPPETALKRLAGRSDKQDNVIFEQLEFQTRAAERFISPEFKQLFTKAGTAVHYLSGVPKADIMRQEAVRILEPLLAPAPTKL